MVILYATKADW